MNQEKILTNCLLAFIKEVQACFSDCPYFKICPNIENKSEEFCLNTILNYETNKEKSYVFNTEK